MTVAPEDAAFTLLENSFNNISFKSYQRDIAEGYDRIKAMRLIPGSHMGSPTSTIEQSPLSRETSIENLKPKSLSPRNRHLPPTPPFQDSDQNHGARDRTPRGHSTTGMEAHRMGLSTPVNLLSPPTPDTTPPYTRQMLQVPRSELNHYPSLSQQGSFVTAREDPASQLSSRSQLGLYQDAQSPAHHMYQKDPGLYGVNGGIDYMNHNYMLDNTPIKEITLPEQLEFADGYHKRNHVNVEVTNDRPDNSNRDVPPNVTVRKARKNKTPLRKPDMVENKLQTPRVQPVKSDKGASHAEPTDHTRTTDTKHDRQRAASNGSDWQHINSDVLYSHLRDQKSKRLSSASHTSTVVEAMVVVPPPKPSRGLRHAGINLALRDDIDTPPRSRRIVSEPHVSHQHRLRHHHLQNHDHSLRARHSLDRPITERNVSSPQPPPEPRKHRELYEPDRTPRQVRERESSPNAVQRPNITNGTTSPPSQGASEGSQASISSVSNGLMSPPKINGVYFAAPSPPGPVSNASSSTIELENPLPSTHRPMPSSKQITRASNITKPVTYLKAPGKGFERVWDDSDLVGPESGVPGNTDRRPSIPESLFSSPDDKHSTLHRTTRSVSDTDHIPRPSMDRLTVNSSRRKSLADHASTRPAHSSTTPLSLRSQFSDRTDQYELNEARTVNLYPHNNESLLLVQQRASKRDSADVQNSAQQTTKPTGLGIDFEPAAVAPPVFSATLDTGTPPAINEKSMRRTSRHGPKINSPLTNPRIAPLPPAIKFIPATPNDELDRQLEPSKDDLSLPDPRASNPVRLTRRQSLMRKARRASESFVLIPLRSLSQNQKNNNNRRRHRSLNLDHRDGGDGERPANLHPLWRPRGFWDDFDSEDEDFDGDRYEYHYDYPDDDHEGVGFDPLPKGGDCSDVEERERERKRGSIFPRKMSRRMPSFRGNGGFLLGNSLGIGRHGTNNRRPYLDVNREDVDGHVMQDGGVEGHEKREGMNGVAKVPGLRKRKSEHMLRALAKSNASDSVRGSGSRRKRPREYKLPGLPVGVQYVGLAGLRHRMRQMRLVRAEQAAEKRRVALRGKIGTTIYHDTR